VTVTRNSQPDRYEIYKAALGEGLPRFRLPVATDDRDVVVDLQSAFALCFERGGFGGRIDYQHDPIWATEDQRRRIRALLNRSGQPAEWLWSHDQIALVAYQIWEEQGRPEGRAEQHWRWAIERLRRQASGR
jgi:hypothetical protein